MANANLIETVETTTVQGEVKITGIEIEFGQMVTLAFKAFFAVLVAAVTIGILAVPAAIFIMAFIAAN